jgi:hypothetical protein
MIIQELVKHRLEELGRDQRELAVAAEVTESYTPSCLSERKLFLHPTGQIFMRSLRPF